MTGLGSVVRIGRKSWIALPAAALIAGTGAMLPQSASAAQASHGSSTLTVSTRGSDTGNCQRHSCKTLGFALTQAHPNDTIIIFPGTYHESRNANVVTPRLKGLTIKSTKGADRTVIDASGNANGLLIEASGVSVIGLTVKEFAMSRVGDLGDTVLDNVKGMIGNATKSSGATKADVNRAARTAKSNISKAATAARSAVDDAASKLEDAVDGAAEVASKSAGSCSRSAPRLTKLTAVSSS